MEKTENMSEEKKQKLKEYQKKKKKYREAKKITIYTNKIKNEIICRL